MIDRIFSWLTTPIIDAIGGKILDAYKVRVASDDASEQNRIDLAKRDMELRSQERIAIIGHWTEPANLLGLIWVAYVASVVLTNWWPALGSVPAIRGDVAKWLDMAAYYFLGRSTLGAVASFIRR